MVGQDTSKTEYKAEIIAKHLKERCESLGVGRSARPLMVSMQGPQGAGK
jgi:pantothenate kinase-related protein Tda10